MSSRAEVIKLINDLLGQLAQSSYDLFTESSAQSVLRKCLPNMQVDVLLMDLYGDSGPHIDFLKTLRRHYPKLPVIGLVQSEDEISQIEFIAHGIQECLSVQGLQAARLNRVLRFARARLASCIKDDDERSYLHALLESIPDKIYFKDRDGRFLRVSQSMAKALGCTSYKELIGKSDLDFFHEDHARAAFQDEQQVMRKREPIVGKLEREVRKDGSEAWVSTTRVPLINSADFVIGTLGISRDVTRLWEAERALDRERLFLRTILDSITDSIFVKDAEGRYLLSNRAHARSIGVADPAEVIGKTVFDFFPEDFARPFHESDLELLNSGEVILEKEEQRKLSDGTVGWFLTSKIPFRNPKTGDIGIVGISREITRRKLLEERVAAAEAKG